MAGTVMPSIEISSSSGDSANWCEIWLRYGSYYWFRMPHVLRAADTIPSLIPIFMWFPCLKLGQAQNKVQDHRKLWSKLLRHSWYNSQCGECHQASFQTRTLAKKFLLNLTPDLVGEPIVLAVRFTDKVVKQTGRAGWLPTVDIQCYLST